MSWTLMTEDTGVSFEQLQREQIDLYRDAWAAARWAFTPTVSVSRGIIPIINDETARYFGSEADRSGPDQVGLIEGVMSRFGRQHVGAPEHLMDVLTRDVAVEAADWVLITIPNQLGVEFNVALLTAIRDISQAVGWNETATTPTSAGMWPVPRTAPGR